MLSVKYAHNIIVFDGDKTYHIMERATMLTNINYTQSCTVI